MYLCMFVLVNIRKLVLVHINTVYKFPLLHLQKNSSKNLYSILFICYTLPYNS